VRMKIHRHCHSTFHGLIIPTKGAPVAKVDSHCTYYIPLLKDMEGKRIDICVLGMKGEKINFKPSAYLTCYPYPYEEIELKLYP